MTASELARLAVAIIFDLLVLTLFAGAVAELYVMLAGYRAAKENRLRGLARDERSILLKSPLAPAVSVVTVAPDASPAYQAFLHNLVKLHYGDHEVMLVLNDPSDDDLMLWVVEFRLYASTRASTGNIPASKVRAVYESHDPIRLIVIEKEPGDYADCLNVALNLAGAPLLALAEPGADISHDALLRTVRPFLESPDQTVAACALVPAPAIASPAERFHTLEALRDWFIVRLGLSRWNATLPSSGCFVLFRRSAVVEARGFYSTPFELLMHMHALYRASRKPYRVGLVQDAVATQKPPASWVELRKETLGRQAEMLAAAGRHLPLMFGFGGLGWLALPGIYWSRAVAPVLELLAYAIAVAGLASGWLPWQKAALLALATIGMGALNSMTAVVLCEFGEQAPLTSRHLTALFVAALPENLVFRFQRNWWLLGGLFTRPARVERTAPKNS